LPLAATEEMMVAAQRSGFAFGSAIANGDISPSHNFEFSGGYPAAEAVTKHRIGRCGRMMPRAAPSDLVPRGVAAPLDLRPADVRFAAKFCETSFRSAGADDRGRRRSGQPVN
jgi:hypothetical protein